MVSSTPSFDTAMIFAAGRGERMRPLTDSRPKPLLEVGGVPLIVWQIRALARAGFTRIVINHAWLGAQIEAALGDGSRFGVHILYSAEGEALETAGGIAQALPLLRQSGDLFVAVSGDVFCDFDYRRLRRHAERLRRATEASMHLVLVPNPSFHPQGDFALDGERLSLAPALPRLTFANIGVYDARTFAAIPAGTRVALGPYFRQAIEAGRATGEVHTGVWENIGTPDQLARLASVTSAAACASDQGAGAPDTDT